MSGPIHQWDMVRKIGNTASNGISVALFIHDPNIFMLAGNVLFKTNKRGENGKQLAAISHATTLLN